MFFSPLHGFKLPFQFTFPYSDIVVAILSTILIIYGGRPFYQGAVDEFKQKKPGMMGHCTPIMGQEKTLLCNQFSVIYRRLVI